MGCDFGRHGPGCLFERPERGAAEARAGLDAVERRARQQHEVYMRGGGLCEIPGCGRRIGRRARWCKEHGQLESARLANEWKRARRGYRTDTPTGCGVEQKTRG